MDPNYPIFVLAAVLVERKYYCSVIVPELKQLKHQLFGTDQIVFHTADITRNRKGFERLKDANFREKFYKKLNEAMRKWDYSVIAVVVDKQRHKQAYGDAALDPYNLSLALVAERLVFESDARGVKAKMVAESRGSHLDIRLKRAWEAIKETGTYYVQGKRFREKVADFAFCNKKDNVAGLQLADLVATPIGRWYLGKSLKEDWYIVESKFRGGPNGYLGRGLIVLPTRLNYSS